MWQAAFVHALVATSDASLAGRLEVILARLGYSSVVEAEPATLIDALLRKPANIVLVDWDSLWPAALDLTEPLRSSPGRPLVVAITRRPIEHSAELVGAGIAFLDANDSEPMLTLRISVISARSFRNRESEDVALLAEASAVFASSLDFETTLRNIARQAVAWLADFCVIYVVTDGRVERAEVVHRDPALQPAANRFKGTRLHAGALAVEVIQTGRPMIVAELAEAIAQRDEFGDPEKAEALRILRPGSAIILPLLAHGRVEGAITLGSERAGRYGEAEQTFASELAARAALAVSNARLHRELTLSENKFRALADATFEGIVVHERGNIVLVNKTFADMLGYSAEEMIGTPVFDTVTPEDRERVRAIVERGTLEPYQAYGLRKDGQTFPAEILAREAEYQGRRVRMAAVRDITERQKLQARIMLSDRLSAMGTLAAGVAHEINNPLSFVSLSIDFAQSRLGGKEPEVERALGDAAAGAERVRRIVKDLRTLSRVDEDRRLPTDVRGVLEASLSIASNELRHKARVIKELFAVPAVAASEWRLGQVFLNLLVNAGQAIAEGAPDQNEVRVRTLVRDGQVVVEISDTGAGIPAEILERIFDPFFTTKPAGVGTGLGLSICQNIVHELSGRIEVASAPGKGTTFTVLLPPAHEDQPRRASAEPAAPPGRRARVLVVDDEPLLRAALLRLLTPAHDATAVASAKDALTLLAKGERYDVLLCDLMMPGMTGEDLHEELKKLAPALAAHTIFLTGGAFSGRAADFLQRIPNPRLEKPFHPDELLAAIARMSA